jgi:hypothetical protein
MDCNWDNPGVDPYTGTPRAAIMAFTHIPKHVRMALVERVEARTTEYDDVIYIDNEGLRSVGVPGRQEHSYDPVIRNMHFGSRGRVCSGVTWRWAAERVESAVVYCEQGYCIARPSVCNNWFTLTPAVRDAGPEPVPEQLRAGGTAQPEQLLVPGLPGGAEPGYGAAPVLGYGGVYSFQGAGGQSFGGGGGYAPLPTYCSPGGSVGAVPEAPPWALVGVGLALLASLARGRRRG